jgi:hypothetical protein
MYHIALVKRISRFCQVMPTVQTAMLQTVAAYNTPQGQQSADMLIGNVTFTLKLRCQGRNSC